MVITRGFLPNQYQTSAVLHIRSRGFKLIWFDGDREAARRAFMKRSPGHIMDLFTQMKRIQQSNVVAVIMPIEINPFRPHGQFKDLKDIADEIESSR